MQPVRSFVLPEDGQDAKRGAARAAADHDRGDGRREPARSLPRTGGAAYIPSRGTLSSQAL